MHIPRPVSSRMWLQKPWSQTVRRISTVAPVIAGLIIVTGCQGGPRPAAEQSLTVEYDSSKQAVEAGLEAQQLTLSMKDARIGGSSLLHYVSVGPFGTGYKRGVRATLRFENDLLATVQSALTTGFAKRNIRVGDGSHSMEVSIADFDACEATSTGAPGLGDLVPV